MYKWVPSKYKIRCAWEEFEVEKPRMKADWPFICNSPHYPHLCEKRTPHRYFVGSTGLCWRNVSQFIRGETHSTVVCFWEHDFCGMKEINKVQTYNTIQHTSNLRFLLGIFWYIVNIEVKQFIRKYNILCCVCSSCL
jgi:hypothetical protein